MYAVVSHIVNQIALEIRLRRVLRDFTLGVLVSGSCLLEDVAHALRPRGTMSSQYRRLQRFLSNDRIDIRQLQREWTQIIIQIMQPEQLLLLVDETALSDHLKVMVLGIWVPGGCIPIAWRSYQATDYPAEGQARLIADLIDRVRDAFPVPLPTLLLADRGIGTSPHLIQAVEQERGIDILFRVQQTCLFRHWDTAHTVALKDLAAQGQVWQGVGDVFKKAGWLPLVATVAQAPGYDQPWCLVSSVTIDPSLYRRRFYQEVSFRDLKSDGFQWHRSHVWVPDHADRLLLVLALAYALVMLVGQALPPATTGRQSRLSTFRRGLESIRDLFRPTIAALLPPPLPPPRMTCVVQ
ncbi:MAG: hypothetical protein H6671_15335 [Anaerolineaceae bacterium]|nr:hypothetical protein [Anaerolineaceae bacterium]